MAVTYDKYGMPIILPDVPSSFPKMGGSFLSGGMGSSLLSSVLPADRQYVNFDPSRTEGRYFGSATPGQFTIGPNQAATFGGNMAAASGGGGGGGGNPSGAGFNWQSLISGLLGGSGASGQSSGIPSWLLPLLGGGMAIGGSLADKEPGEVTEARQYLRNYFTSPNTFNRTLTDSAGAVRSAFGPELAPGSAERYLTGLYESPSDPFAEGGIYSRYLPLLDQQKTSLLNDVQQRALAGMPAGLSPTMSGPELAAMRSTTANRIAPVYSALAGDLMRENQGIQQNAANSVLGQEESRRNFVGDMSGYGLKLPFDAAGKILDTSKPDPTASAIAQLGTILAMQGLMGGQGVAGGGGLLSQLGSLLGGGQSGSGGILGQLGSLFGLGGETPPILPGVGGAAGAAGMDFGLPGAGLLGPAGVSSLQGLLSLFGSGASGGFLGNQVGKNIENSWGATGAGAASGAATGFAVGGPIGALVGAIAGGAGGLFGSHKANVAKKAAFHAEDVNSQRDQTLEMGNLGNSWLQRLGADQPTIDAWNTSIQQLANTEGGQTAAASRLGQIVLAQAKKVDPSVTSLTQIPGMRDEFISYMIANTFTAGNSAYGGGAPLNFIGAPGHVGTAGLSSGQAWVNLAGLAKGGRVMRPMMALVGEEGPEVAYLQPGSVVMPLSPSRN